MKIFNKFKLQTYNVGFVISPIDSILKNGIGKKDIQWLKHGYKDRFFADPFLYDEDEKNYYIVCEEYLFVEKKGKITLLTVDKKRFELVERKTIIEEAFHLSFPFCQKGENYIIPESSGGDAMYKYSFDDNFAIIAKEKIFDEGLIDAVFYSSGSFNFILGCRKQNPKSDLYICTEQNGAFVFSSANPILSDLRYSRSAGQLFRIGNELYRPVQDSVDRYGKFTRIVKIIELNKNKYVFEETAKVDSSNNPPFNETLHTFNVYNDIIIVDGSKDYFRPFYKVFLKIKNKKRRC